MAGSVLITLHMIFSAPVRYVYFCLVNGVSEARSHNHRVQGHIAVESGLEFRSSGCCAHTFA